MSYYGEAKLESVGRLGGGPAINGPCNGPAAPPRDRVQLVIQTEHLEKACVQAHTMFDTLISKLSPVVRAAPAEACGNSSPEVPLVPLAEDLRKRTREIERLTARIADAIDRIEL